MKKKMKKDKSLKHQSIEQKLQEFEKTLKELEPYLAKGDEKIESTFGKWIETTKALDFSY
jgi:chaperonin cofactor prefoldin